MAIKLTDFLNDTPEESKDQSKEPLTESVITETIQDNKPSPNLDAILQEWSWRCDKGYPDFNNLSDRFKLQEVLDEMKIDLPFERMAEAPAKKEPVKKAATKAAATKPAVKKNKKLTFPGNDAILVKGSTGLKEGLVMFAMQQDEDVLRKALDKLKNKSAESIPFDTSVIIDKLMEGGEGGPLEVKQAINYFNSTAIIVPKEIEAFSNGFTSGLLLRRTLGKIDSNLIDRGHGDFNTIKKRGIELLKAQGVKGISSGESDKWCPADIFIYPSSGMGSEAESAITLNVEKKGDVALNALFMDDFKRPSDNKILAISLKEQEARHGKATSFRKILESNEDYVAEKDEAQKAATELVGSLGAITRTSGANRTPEDRIGGAAAAIAHIRNKKDELNSIKVSVDDLELKLNEFLISVFGKNNLENVNNKEKAKKAWRLDQKTKKSFTFDESSKKLTNLRVAIKTYKTSLLKYATTSYNKSRAQFIKTLTDTGFKAPQDPPVSFKASDEDKLDEVANTLLKKSGCYDVASKLLDGLQKKASLKIPPAFKSLIAEDKNVFLALTAFALSQGGVSPTFFKLVGAKKPTDTAKVHKFPGDGILTLVKGGTVDIKDTPDNAGFDASFKCQILEDGKAVDKYQVVLSFGYAGDTFKIEITELADLK